MTAALGRFGLERRPLRLADAALAVWIAVLAAVTVYGAATTTGFLTWSNLKAILTAAAFVGIIAVGLTVIVLSGNLFSLALGQTAAISAMVFLYALRIDLGAAIVLTLLLGLAIGAVQGFAVGAWGANPIIVTIGAAGLMEGMAVWLSHGQSIVPPAGATSWEHLANPVLGLPAPVYVFLVVTIVLAVVMRRTRFGRQIYLLGENRVAARAAALPITLLTVGAFGIASLYTAGSGILIGATSANASLLLTGSYTYDAIAAALVGGNAVTGGRGSIARTAAGAIFIATISDMLLLRGYSTGGQILVRGIIVVVVVVLTNLQGAQPMSAARARDASAPARGRAGALRDPRADDPGAGAPARAHALHGAHGERLRHLPELRLVRPRGARARHHDHRGRVRSLRLVDVPPRRHGRGADGRRLAARSASSRRSAPRSSSASSRAA